MSSRRNETGFTLIELLIALALSGIISGIIYATYLFQVKGAISQEIMVDMNQTTRAALTIMEDEIRMAGCDPTGKADAHIIKADPAEFTFTMDVQNNSGLQKPDGDTDDGNEYIHYALNNDANHDGRFDHIPCDLGRGTSSVSGLQPFAENVDALNFVYLDDKGNPLPAGFTFDQISAVQVTLVARSGEKSRWALSAYKDTTEYRNQQGTVILPAQNDNFKRLMLTTTIFCRNLQK